MSSTSNRDSFGETGTLCCKCGSAQDRGQPICQGLKLFKYSSKDKKQKGAGPYYYKEGVLCLHPVQQCAEANKAKDGKDKKCKPVDRVAALNETGYTGEY